MRSGPTARPPHGPRRSGLSTSWPPRTPAPPLQQGRPATPSAGGSLARPGNPQPGQDGGEELHLLTDQHTLNPGQVGLLTQEGEAALIMGIHPPWRTGRLLGRCPCHGRGQALSGLSDCCSSSRKEVGDQGEEKPHGDTTGFSPLSYLQHIVHSTLLSGFHTKKDVCTDDRSRVGRCDYTPSLTTGH